MSGRELIGSVTDFYDSIASDYNSHMTESDKRARESVRDLFKKHVASGVILDFGGGTGLDLPWMLEYKYSVVLVEPSEKMRSVAKANNKSNNVTFIETSTVFTDWSGSKLPFHQKADGILANFAVLNCIENVDLLFEKLSLVSAENCHIVATVIDPRFGKMMKNYSVLAAMRMMFRSRLTIHNKYEGQLHPTYIHSIASLKKASGKYFELQTITSLDVSSFAVLIFKKK